MSGLENVELEQPLVIVQALQPSVTFILSQFGVKAPPLLNWRQKGILYKCL